jgi:hypothetical protein
MDEIEYEQVWNGWDWIQTGLEWMLNQHISISMDTIESKQDRIGLIDECEQIFITGHK